LHSVIFNAKITNTFLQPDAFKRIKNNLTISNHEEQTPR